ncbi:hypothetical protein HF1_06690 [Mycoplasma haemofelis str. Langford 1]|uniref:Uncharacterized protein n=1 Tax=Mycoplasma haemofelis (strain Langford 1) TaxID=941640 RepID=E8ZHQ6_MYCHL|nr:hypothetical protein [Mycoplasma haemofelis]CBY92677.1 hypothetical protein HF1_06690 [Mycoplasma haemofelis str. Langford 1]
MNFKDLLSELRKKLLQHSRLLISFTCTTVSVTSIIPLINTQHPVKLSDESLREISEVLGIEEEVSELPISSKDRLLVNEILRFEVTHGCKIHFVKNDREGSHHRVDDDFWVDYSKSHSDIYEKFFEIVGNDEIINECKKLNQDDKLWIRNRYQRWVFSAEDQSNNAFKEWSISK